MLTWHSHYCRGLDFAELEAKQSYYVARVNSAPHHAHLLISEPKPTYTHGRSAKPTDLLWSEERLREVGIQSHSVSRGGKWTFHGPGQILIYPLVQLRALGLDSKQSARLLVRLRQTIADSLRQLGVEDLQLKQPFGLYVANKKLVSFGIAVQDGVCMHGLALYLEPQNHFFSGIHPCGQTGQQPISLHELGFRTRWWALSQKLAGDIKNSFGNACLGL